MGIKTIHLEGNVVYAPITHSLYKAGDSENQVALAIPASLCLLSLLQHKGEIVSHSDLLSFAWEARGMMVSPNTVYQNMSILRKALESMGVSSEMIRTVPKRGFMIPAGFPVEFIYENEDNTPLSQAEEEIIPVPTPVLPSALQDPPSIPDTSVPAAPAAGKTNRRLQAVLFGIACCMAFLIATAATRYLGNDTIPAYIAPDFSPLGNVKDCQVFRNYSSRDDAFFTKFIADKNVECGTQKWWYITNYPPSEEVSILRCSKELTASGSDKTPLCTSDFYSENGQQQ